MNTFILAAVALVVFGLLTARTVMIVLGLAQFIRDCRKE